MLDYIVFVDTDSGELIPDASLKQNCVIFGAGYMGANYYQYISRKYKVLAYIDNNPLLLGSIVNSLPVLSPKDLKRLSGEGDFDILTCTYYANESIASELKRMGLSSRIITPKLLEAIQDEDESLINEEEFHKSLSVSKQAYLKKTRDGRIKIIFVVHLLQLFSSYESIYEEMLEDERFDPIILLSPRREGRNISPYLDYDYYLEEFLNARGYSYIKAYRDGKWVELFSLNPDGIFYQTPYTYPQLPYIYREEHYSDCVKIIHTPYGVLPTDHPGSLIGKQAGAYKDFLNRCWRLFFDRPNYDAFIGNEALAEKIVLSGTPKVDFYVRGIKAPEAYFKNTKSKKILYTPTWMIAKGRSSFLKYYSYFLQLLQKEDIELVVRPHPFLLTELMSTDHISEAELEHIMQAFQSNERCLFDTCGDYRCAILDSDFAIMDISSLTYEYLPTGKPLILHMQNEDRFGVKQFIKDSSYVATTREELAYYVDMLLSGEDPLLQRRLEIVRSMDDLFPNGGSNGAYISNYVAEHIRKQ